MKAKIIHVLCEGQTEQGFVEEVLRPYLQAQGVSGVKSILITTRRKRLQNHTHVSFHLKQPLLKQSTMDVSFPISSCMNLKHCSFAALTILQSVIPVVRNAANS